MDYRRIEWLFFIIFLAIDVFLIYEIVQTPVQLTDTATTGNINNIRSEIKADNIEVPKVSDNAQTGYYLAAKDEDYLQNIKVADNISLNYSQDSKILSAKLQKPIAISHDNKKALKQVINFKNNPEYVTYGKEFTYEPNLSDENTYVFVQDTEYGKIYGSNAQLEITIDNHQITAYQESYLGKVRAVRELQTTISGWRAIETLYTYRQLPNNSKISWINLGYSKLTDVRKNTILLPTWIVGIENKPNTNVVVKRVNAFNDQVMQDNVDNKN